jgi:hypothetical protein
MFVLETKGSAAARKSGILMMIALGLTGSWGLMLTLHTYVRPSPPPPPGLRIFGFPRPHNRSTATSPRLQAGGPSGASEFMRSTCSGQTSLHPYLALNVANDEAGVGLLDRPRWREVAGRHQHRRGDGHGAASITGLTCPKALLLLNDQGLQPCPTCACNTCYRFF